MAGRIPNNSLVGVGRRFGRTKTLEITEETLGRRWSDFGRKVVVHFGRTSSPLYREENPTKTDL